MTQDHRKQILNTLYPPTGQTIQIFRNGDSLVINVYGDDGNREAFRVVSRHDLIKIAEHGV
jgi:hypothetical protein